MTRLKREMVMTSVYIPMDDYIKAALLVLDGEFDSLASIIRKGLREVLLNYPDDFFEELKKKYSDVIDDITKRSMKKEISPRLK